ncbi:Uncharacterized protein SCF082_LOCUS53371 [Durusdinium trenchii]|uniref:Sushi domain-containing protein n=1 Tax=Durusdinium trenchii TaxID=1381693 RepID=A0ABP0SS76_9DINO
MEVTAKCKAAFKGSPVVLECEEDLTPYKLLGCASELCVPPADLAAYEVTETSLARGAFVVEATCKDGYSGSAEAFVCGRDGEPYELFGCDTTTSTLTTTTTTTETTTTTSTYTTTTTSTSTVTSTTSTSTTTETTTSTTTTTETTTSTTTSTTILSCMEVVDKAYQVTVNSLEVRAFQATASCREGYQGDAKVEACDAPDKPFKLSGCKAVVCQTPSDTSGYVLTEVSVKQLDFNIQAQCAPFFHGSAAVEKCAEHDEEYGLSGCELDRCRSPDDTTGYIVTETDLTLKDFQVKHIHLNNYYDFHRNEHSNHHINRNNNFNVYFHEHKHNNHFDQHYHHINFHSNQHYNYINFNDHEHNDYINIYSNQHNNHFHKHGHNNHNDCNNNKNLHINSDKHHDHNYLYNHQYNHHFD